MEVTRMVLGTLFEQFVLSAPICVMTRALLENIFAPAKLDSVFDRAAEQQYHRELLFSTLVDLMGFVVTRRANSVHAAVVDQRDRIPVSIKAVYDKLSHVEGSTARALVRNVASDVSELIDLTNGRLQPLLKGYRVRILDGNHLGKTDHRLGVLRGTSAGALPGQALVLLDPQRMVIDDIICCEDGHAQERSILHEVLPGIKARDLLIDDRNFCTLAFLFGLTQCHAYFITRQHGRMPFSTVGKRRYIGLTETGRVYEQAVQLRDPATGEKRRFRRITVQLNTPTRDGDAEIHLLTNLPASRVSALKVAALYRKRWTLEQAFYELTLHLRCELNTLGYPKAALFAFSVAVCSYNLLAAVKGALRGVHGQEKTETEVSTFFLTNEVKNVYAGMMVALPPPKWKIFQKMSPADMAAHLLRWARTADLKRYPKHRHGPKKPKQPCPNAQFQHVATAKLLEEKRLRAKLKGPRTARTSR
jgi:Transposase DDE domain